MKGSPEIADSSEQQTNRTMNPLADLPLWAVWAAPLFKIAAKSKLSTSKGRMTYDWRLL